MGRRPKSGCTLPPPPHSDAAHAAITAELVACILGQRERPELRIR